ncbi:MAG TPA: T9SS type A sorting domain-containing protein, partial [Cyclobacteriaceae bacterium]|nr:T9SS type A sorting domain-containing protein [Cyclobacteriaceae bacterium]
VTGIEDTERKKVFEVYPNPVSLNEKLTIQVNGSGMSSIDLMDMTGRVVKQVYAGEVCFPFTKDIELSTLSRGLYFIRLSLDGKIMTSKVFVN